MMKTIGEEHQIIKNTRAEKDYQIIENIKGTHWAGTISAKSKKEALIKYKKGEYDSRFNDLSTRDAKQECGIEFELVSVIFDDS